MPLHNPRVLFAALVPVVALTLAPRPAAGEYIPPQKLPDLLAAEFIAIGHFTGKPDNLQFSAARIVRGDPAAAAALIQTESKPGGAIRTSDTGTIQILIAGSNRLSRMDIGGTALVNADTDGLWFFRPAVSPPYRIALEPLELTDGIAALLRNQQPDAFFHLLQGFNFDEQRQALEDLFARPDAALVARLHEVALNPKSDAAYEATDALIQTQQLDPAKFWQKWYDLRASWRLRDALVQKDPARTMTELKAAIAAEKNAARLEALLNLIPYDSSEKLDLNLPYLDHADPAVRQHVLGAIWDTAWALNVRAEKDAAARGQLESFGRRVLPLLEARDKVETDASARSRLTTMLSRQDNIPWLLKIPADTLHTPIPAYTEAAEEEFLIHCLISQTNDYIARTAGRELAEHFGGDAFKRLSDAFHSPNFNKNIVLEGIGYLPGGQSLDFLSAQLGQFGGPNALGHQNRKEVLPILKRAFDVGGRIDSDSRGYLEAVGELSDPEALPFLKTLQPRVQLGGKLPFVRACARQGDPWAIDELLAALQTPPTAKFLDGNFYNRQDLANALCLVDTAQATAALKTYVADTWPHRTVDGFSLTAQLENYAGNSRRSTPLAEVARRDPNWLASFALHMIDLQTLASRQYGASVFQQLTGRLGTYRPEAFAAERSLRVQLDWLNAHQTESRETWLVSYFREKGFPLTRLEKSALPILAQALSADFATYNLAAEQISAICQKYFADFPQQPGTYQGQERTTVRIRGWLEARHLFAGTQPRREMTNDR